MTIDDAVTGFVPKVPVMPVGQPDTASVTAELNPFAGAIVTVDAPADPAVAEAAVALNVKLGGTEALTVSPIVVLADKAPLVPFTGSVYGPGATLAATLIVTADDVAAGLVANVPVMPAGQPDAASVTPELNPFAGVTVTVDVPVEPAVAVAAAALNVKLGGAVAPAGAKNIPLATGPPDPFAVTLIVTLPLIFHTP